jgi:cell division protease FtsH
MVNQSSPEGRHEPTTKGTEPLIPGPEDTGFAQHLWPPSRWNVWFIMALVWIVFLGSQVWWENTQVKTIDYSEFIALEHDGLVRNLSVSTNEIVGEFTSTDEGRPKRFRTVRVDQDFADQLSTKGIDFKGVAEDGWFSRTLAWLLPLLIIVGFWTFILRRTMAGGMGGGLGSGLMSVGKSRAKVYAEESVKVTFDDVAGVDEAKEELAEIIGFLRDPEHYGRLGARLPKGILLVGPPGTGKTLLAKAVAGEAGVPFFSISGSEFVEMFVGVGAARVRDLFEQARARAPCIIFIDELDALGRARGIGPMMGGHDEKEQTLNQLLAELDGFDPRDGVVLLAATNRPEILDAALLRAGRFDRQVLVDRPDKLGRIAIIEVHLKKVSLFSDVRSDEIAALTPGFTGADLANLVNEAALLATRDDSEYVEMKHFNLAIERIVAGLEKRNRLLNPHERTVTAYHEIGHALVARTIPGSDPIHKVSIIPRGIAALGYTIQRPIEDRFLMSRGELADKMAILLGGRAAESIFFDDISTGASDDLAKATDIARSMVTRYGMDEKIGLVSLEGERSAFLQGPTDFAVGRRDFSEETAREIDCAVRELVDRAFEQARAILEDHRELVVETAERLLEKETLTGDDLPEIAGVTD